MSSTKKQNNQPNKKLEDLGQNYELKTNLKAGETARESNQKE
ncbi:hypothetical protein MN210_18065 [Psychrobacter raelei]|uniref:Uncharacterized protein n=1 Tax=Psychrobacter raelei TaxID=2565531 RepID=A0AAU6PW10_9GAMM